MLKDNGNGFLVYFYGRCGYLDCNGRVKAKKVEGQVVNESHHYLYRSYTSDDGVYHLDGTWDTFEHVQQALYRYAGQQMEEMLRKGWVNITASKTMDKASNIHVSVFGKTKDGDKGWDTTFSIIAAPLENL